MKISDLLILHFYTEEKLTRRCIVCTIKIATLQGSKEKVKNSIKNLELITTWMNITLFKSSQISIILDISYIRVLL